MIVWGRDRTAFGPQNSTKFADFIVAKSIFEIAFGDRTIYSVQVAPMLGSFRGLAQGPFWDLGSFGFDRKYFHPSRSFDFVFVVGVGGSVSGGL